MGIRQKTILLLIFSSFMSVGWGQDCVDDLEVELWDECYSIHETVLTLSGHNLYGEIPVEIGNLTSLTNLYLSFNQLTGTIPSSIGNLTNLKNLYLTSNQLTGIPPEIENLTNLENLYLDNNLLTEIPVEIGNLTNLIWLRLQSNQLTGEIPQEVCDLIESNNLEMYFILNGNNLINTCE